MKKPNEQLIRRYAGLYETCPAERSEFGWPLCLYCGDPADKVAHVPALNQIRRYRALGLKRETYLLIKCCSQCEKLLGNDVFPGIAERVNALKFRLTRWACKSNSFGRWTQEEIDQLGDSLRSQIAAQMRQDAALQRRIDYRAGLDLALRHLAQKHESPG